MKEVIQVGVDRYMDVYTRDLKERTRVRDMRGMVQTSERRVETV